MWSLCRVCDRNIYWASVGTVKQIFNPDSGCRLTDLQLINHFPNHFELTRKVRARVTSPLTSSSHSLFFSATRRLAALPHSQDLMVKNYKRYMKDTSRDNSLSGPPGGPGAPLADFVPVTYLLPADYNLFVEVPDPDLAQP